MSAETVDHSEVAPANESLDAVIVCGMGPVALRATKNPDNLVARNVYNFLNAIGAKLLVAHSVADQAIVSGFQSSKDIPVSEAALLSATYRRATPKGMEKEARAVINERVVLEEEARTTFGNIIQAINMLDQESGGYWEGSFAVLSSEFHGPRIAEMLEAFGLTGGRVLSAERIFRRFGYKGRLHPVKDSGFGNSWVEFEESVYRGQPAGLQNLQDNPSYVTFELAAIRSDRRFHEIATSLASYYEQRQIALPEAFGLLPRQYSPDTDYGAIRQAFAAIPFSKHPYGGDSQETLGYREFAAYTGESTDDFLESLGL